MAILQIYKNNPHGDFLKHSDSTTKSIVTRSHAYLYNDMNKPFPSYPKPLFQSEAKSKAICEFQTLSISKGDYVSKPF